MTAARSLRVGVTQWHATSDADANATIAVRLIDRAAAAGASLVVLPENGLMLGSNTQMRAAAFTVDAPQIRVLSECARRSSVVVVVGGLKYRTENGVFNSALVIDRDGAVVGRYDKIHLFDAQIGGQSFEASSVELAGTQPVILDVDGVRLGVTICYDVRFPELFGNLARHGAEVLLVPAAFLASTGAAHWHTLLRARAIENLAYVVAPATVHSPDPGYHDAFRTYGHGLVVSPWGEVLADLGIEAEAFAVVELDLDEVVAARRKLPVLTGRRDQWVYQEEPELITTAPTGRS